MGLQMGAEGWYKKKVLHSWRAEQQNERARLQYEKQKRGSYSYQLVAHAIRPRKKKKFAIAPPQHDAKKRWRCSLATAAACRTPETTRNRTTLHAPHNSLWMCHTKMVKFCTWVATRLFCWGRRFKIRAVFRIAVAEAAVFTVINGWNPGPVEPRRVHCGWKKFTICKHTTMNRYSTTTRKRITYAQIGTPLPDDAKTRQSDMRF